MWPPPRSVVDSLCDCLYAHMWSLFLPAMYLVETFDVPTKHNDVTRIILYEIDSE